MKKSIPVIACLLCLLIWAGVNAFQRVDQFRGFDTLTAYNADYADWQGQPVKLLEASGANNRYGRGYTAIKAGAIVTAFAVSPLDADSLSGIEGAVDTAILTLYAKTDFNLETLIADTVTSLPGTLLVDYNYFFEDSDTAVAEVRRSKMLNDFLYLDVHAADSAGSADTMQTTIQWFLNLVEE